MLSSTSNNRKKKEREYNNKIKDEETGLLCSSSSNPAYGAMTSSGDETSSSSPRSHKPSSNQSEHNSVKKRKKRRMEQRQCCDNKSAIAGFSTLLRTGSDNDEVSDTRQIADLVLPALDPNAKEVIDSIVSCNNHAFMNLRQQQINFSTIRAKYRNEKKKSRRTIFKRKSFKEYIIDFYAYNSKVRFIKNLLFANKTIIMFVNLDLWVDFFFCLAYLIEMKQESSPGINGLIEPTSWLYTWRSFNLWIVCLVLAYWNICSFFIRFFIAKHPISVIFSFRCLIEILTTVPFLVSVHIPNGQYLYVPYFVRSSILLLRIKSVMKIRINLQIADRPVDPLRTKLIHLVSTLVVLLYNGTCAFQYTESKFGAHKYTIMESLYVVMVTLSTVGYGDITPNTQASRLVMMMLIVIALSILPGLIGDVLDTLRKRKDGEGHVNKNISPFILIVGSSFTQDQVVEILDGFLNRENAEYRLSIVFLDSNRPTEQLKSMERNSIWGHYVQFLHGSVLDEKTLLRVEARYAKAIFTISDQNASEPSREDEKNTVRLWSLYCHTVSHQVHIYAYNLSPNTAIYQKVAKEIICVREFKQYLLAMNCRCRGASTLLTNLLHQRQPTNRYDEGWQAQFDDGSCNEIYTSKAPLCVYGLTFTQAALFLFEEAQIILFAIKTFMKDKENYEILLNPSNSYEINPMDECVFIAESPKEIQDIVTLSKPDPSRFSCHNASNNQYKDDSVVNNKASSSSYIAQAPSESSNITQLSYQPLNSNKSDIDILPRQSFRIAELPSKRHALLTGSRELIKRIGQSPTPDENSRINDTSLPLCYLLDEPAKLEEVTVQTTEGMSNHILVCLHREMINMFKFIYNLRSPSIRPEEIQNIVLLCAKPPTQKMFDLINTFPRVYFMEGNCRHPDDLLRAGAKRAKQIVIMSEKEYLDQYEHNSDSPAVMTSHILDLLLQERPKDAYTIVNLGK
ncbi:MAG: hypothetical protein EXX96DRAFT_588656 [Benjaminiella poitrasii]|nr:MAG: hypothetical protein EXX96DRAFT_588656 [Benjaminiella poitrasii]